MHRELTTHTVLSWISSDSATALVRPQLDGAAWQKNRGKQIRKPFHLPDSIPPAVCAHINSADSFNSSHPLEVMKDFHTLRTVIHANITLTCLCTSLYQEVSAKERNFPSRDDPPLGTCYTSPGWSCKRNSLSSPMHYTDLFLNTNLAKAAKRKLCVQKLR